MPNVRLILLLSLIWKFPQISPPSALSVASLTVQTELICTAERLQHSDINLIKQSLTQTVITGLVIVVRRALLSRNDAH